MLAIIPYNRKKFIRKNSKLLLVKYISCKRFKSVTVDEKKNSQQSYQLTVKNQILVNAPKDSLTDGNESRNKKEDNVKKEMIVNEKVWLVLSKLGF